MILLENIAANLQAVRTKKPLVHHITNYVTVNDCANITLALGGSPVMADDIAEVSEMTAFASALVLNIGTLNARTIPSMLAAGKAANQRSIPVILDPVGAGATKLRTETAETIIREIRPAIIRGNMAEIKIIAGLKAAIQGVDSATDESDAQTVAEQLAGRLGCIVAITGKQDVVTDGKQTCLIDNGHELLTKVTGTGCMTTSLVGTYAGSAADLFVAAVAGILSMGIAGELAEQSLKAGDGIGTFKTRLFDNIYNLDRNGIIGRNKVRLV